MKPFLLVSLMGHKVAKISHKVCYDLNMWWWVVRWAKEAPLLRVSFTDNCLKEHGNTVNTFSSVNSFAVKVNSVTDSSSTDDLLNNSLSVSNFFINSSSNPILFCQSSSQRDVFNHDVLVENSASYPIGNGDCNSDFEIFWWYRIQFSWLRKNKFSNRDFNFIPTIREGLSIYYTNADSLLNKMEELRLHVLRRSVDIIVISEVYPTMESSLDIANSEISIPGYNLFKSKTLFLFLHWELSF